MCLIAFAWKAHPRWRLLLVGNRDEFHARPTAPLAAWPDAGGMLAGRDLEAGGTWMGAAPGGRVAAVTNVRLPQDRGGDRSRGWLVRDFLAQPIAAAAHAQALAMQAQDYRPFNLLMFDAEAGFYLGNRPGARLESITPGVHGLSNADFNAPWPKTKALMRALTDWLHAGDAENFAPLWQALGDATEWPDALLPDTGIGIERERMLSASFIRGADYGTRASTLVAVGHDGSVWMIERRFGPHGRFLSQTRLSLPPHS
ncbi:NRDE family protein [Oleiagrimonas sp. C23AA]|uniref:NRDE family protein n=1 Tax=Oleiagrimonas sp. C23AA TaxID=2719047 RepID=UPI001423C92C|nr:NRDE family protein [Oleiagrimonas sp. C23AA]NII12191.1 NRDE family protein [Oleiagrimonas sp. C23AA]